MNLLAKNHINNYEGSIAMCVIVIPTLSDKMGAENQNNVGVIASIVDLRSCHGHRVMPRCLYCGKHDSFAGAKGMGRGSKLCWSICDMWKIMVMYDKNNIDSIVTYIYAYIIYQTTMYM